MRESEAARRLRAAGCVFAEDEARLLLAQAGSGEALDVLVQRRVAGAPLETVLGWVDFAGLRLAVAPGVFIPRRRSQVLVAAAVQFLEKWSAEPPIVLDLCCGVGAVGAGIVAQSAKATVHAVDIDPDVVTCARRNLQQPQGFVHLGDLYEPLPRELRRRVACIVANAPYVPTQEIELMPSEARDHEPAVALDGGADGLDVQRAVIAGAPDWLAPGGRLLVETSRRQAEATAALFTERGLTAQILRDEDVDGTVVAGDWRPPAH